MKFTFILLQSPGSPVATPTGDRVIHILLSLLETCHPNDIPYNLDLYRTYDAGITEAESTKSEGSRSNSSLGSMFSRVKRAARKVKSSITLLSRPRGYKFPKPKTIASTKPTTWESRGEKTAAAATVRSLRKTENIDYKSYHNKGQK
jgi:hypothetical protein